MIKISLSTEKSLLTKTHNSDFHEMKKQVQPWKRDTKNIWYLEALSTQKYLYCTRQDVCVLHLSFSLYWKEKCDFCSRGGKLRWQNLPIIPMQRCVICMTKDRNLARGNGACVTYASLVTIAATPSNSKKNSLLDDKTSVVLSNSPPLFFLFFSCLLWSYRALKQLTGEANR